MGPSEIRAITAAIGTPIEGWNTSAAMADAVSMIRAYCGERGLGADGTIPPECRWVLGAIFRFRMISSLPVEALNTEARAIEYASAEKFLLNVAAGRAKITLPDPIETPQAGLTRSTGTPWICAPERTHGLAQLDGS